MQIELYIEGQKKNFSVPFVPMLARRKYLELLAEAEEREETTERDGLEEEDKMVMILSDVVFQGQFTKEQLLLGASYEYAIKKLNEAVFGKPKEQFNTAEEGNEKGK